MKKCKICNEPIPAGRLKALPGTNNCTKHSEASSYKANIVTHGKSDDDLHQEFEIIRDPRLVEELNHYKNQMGQFK